MFIDINSYLVIIVYIIKQTAKNVVVIETDKGNKITIVFQKEHNPDIKNIVTIIC